jgi:hypothetical protein
VVLGVVPSLFLSFGGLMINIRRHYATAFCTSCIYFLEWPFNLLLICLISYALILLSERTVLSKM